MKCELLGISIITAIILLGSIESSFAEESLSWKSEYLVGILDSEIDASVPVTITTFSKDSLKLEWEKPTISKDKKITGFEILRKDLNSDYHKVAEITNPKIFSYLDMNLDEGYYGYKIVPVLMKIESNKIPMHGIDRQHSFFPIYVQGQQLVAQYLLKQNCLKCFDESFKEIDDIFQYDFPEYNKRVNNEYQQNLDSESLRTKNLFESLFKIKSNH